MSDKKLREQGKIEGYVTPVAGPLASPRAEEPPPGEPPLQSQLNTTTEAIPMDAPRTYESVFQVGPGDAAVLLSAEDWLHEDVETWADAERRSPVPGDSGPSRAGILRAIAQEIAELRRERTQWAEAYTRLVSAAPSAGAGAPDDDPPNIAQDLVDQFLAALYYGGSWTFDQAASRESIFRRRLREALGVADAAIAAAHEVIGQCDCGMDEPPPNPKKAWHAARDAYWARPSEPPEGHTEDCLSMLTPNGNCDCGLLLRQVRTRNRKADDRQKLLNLLDAVPCPKNHQPVACGCGAYRKALTDALLTAGYRLARAAPPEGQASGEPSDKAIEEARLAWHRKMRRGAA